MTSQTQGIQQLLAAEKKAAEKVAEARKRKARRLKQAKDEATEEIEKYRQERERQFKEFEAKHMGSREGVAAKIETDTRVKLDDMDRHISSRKEPVIQEILNFVYQITPEMHKNYTKKIFQNQISVTQQEYETKQEKLIGQEIVTVNKQENAPKNNACFKNEEKVAIQTPFSPVCNCRK